MDKKLFFLYKDNGENYKKRGIGAVTYIDKMGFHCGHYFGGGNLQGAGFSVELKLDKIDFDNITTILTKKEFEVFVEKMKELHDLGYGLDSSQKQDIRDKGYEILDFLECTIYSKLASRENQELFERVIKEEKEKTMEKFYLDKDTVDLLYDYYKDINYNHQYQDSEIIIRVFEDFEEIGQDWVDNGCIELSDSAEQYFDYEAYGKDIVSNNDFFYELADGRIAEFMM